MSLDMSNSINFENGTAENIDTSHLIKFLFGNRMHR
jgi:hypothetical protein